MQIATLRNNMNLDSANTLVSVFPCFNPLDFTGEALVKMQKPIPDQKDTTQKLRFFVED